MVADGPPLTPVNVLTDASAHGLLHDPQAAVNIPHRTAKALAGAASASIVPDNDLRQRGGAERGNSDLPARPCCPYP
jgi:hypothetical protein